MAVWDLLNSGMRLLGRGALADVGKGLCCPQTEAPRGHNTFPTQDAPRQIPYLRVCLPQRKARLLEQAQSTKSAAEHATRGTSCLLYVGKRKQALEMFVLLTASKTL